MRVSTGDEADVLGTDAPEPAGRPSRALAVALCSAAVLVAVPVAVLQRQEPEPARPLEVFGWMHFSSIDAQPVELPYADRQERDGTATGVIRLELPDESVQGDARLEFGASLEESGGADVVVHAWGDVRVRFGAVLCRGHFGWSNYVEPLDGGGSLHVRCDDGAVLAGRLAPTPQTQASSVTVDIEDGWYVPGQ